MLKWFFNDPPLLSRFIYFVFRSFPSIKRIVYNILSTIGDDFGRSRGKSFFDFNKNLCLFLLYLLRLYLRVLSDVYICTSATKESVIPCIISLVQLFKSNFFDFVIRIVIKALAGVGQDV